MGSVTQGFSKMLHRADDATGRAAPAPRGPDRINRHSSGLQEFTRALAGREGLCILDLGPTSPTNIARLTGLGHKTYSEDVLLASSDPAFNLGRTKEGQTIYDVESFLKGNLVYPAPLFDGVLCWDLCDYLDESLVRPAVERIGDAMRRGGVLLAFFHTRDAGPDAPHYRYHILGDDLLELQPGSRARLQRVFHNRHIENLFSGFSSLKFFLARDNVREVLAVR